MLAVAHLVRRRLDRDHHGVVVAVVGALDLHDHVAAGEAAREVDGVHRRLGAGVGEAPVGEAPAAAQLLRHHDRALGRRGEVRALVHLRLDRGGDRRVRVADAHHAEAVVEVEVLVAVDVPHLRADAALDVGRPRVVALERGRHAAGHDVVRALEVLARAPRPFDQPRLLALGEGGDVGVGRRGQGHGRRLYAAAWRIIQSRSAARRTFPLAVFGSSSAKSTTRGYLYGAVWALTWSWSSPPAPSDGREAVAQDDDRAHDAAALLVGRRHDRGLGHRGVGDERGLDLERADPVAGGDDHVVEPALEVEVAVVVAADAVAGLPGPGRRGLAAEVADEERRHGRGVGDELAVEHVERHARQRAAHRARPRLLAERHAGELAGLGLAVAVADPQPGGLVPGAQHLGVQRLAGGDEPAQRGNAPQRRPLGDHAVLGRRHAERVDLLAREDLEPLVGIEARVVQQRGRAPQPRGDEDVARRLRPARGGRAPRQPLGAPARASARPALPGR